MKPAADDFDRKIGERIRLRRNELALSMVDVGKAIGLTHQGLQKIEVGRSRASGSHLARLGIALHVDPGYFFEAPPSGNGELNGESYVLTAEGAAMYNAISRIEKPELRRQILRTVVEIANAYGPRPLPTAAALALPKAVPEQSVERAEMERRRGERDAAQDAGGKADRNR